MRLRSFGPLIARRGRGWTVHRLPTDSFREGDARYARNLARHWPTFAGDVAPRDSERYRRGAVEVENTDAGEHNRGLARKARRTRRTGGRR